MSFAEYNNFIYLNSTLTSEEARDVAVDCWNMGLTKEEALEIAEEREETLTHRDVETARFIIKHSTNPIHIKKAQNTIKTYKKQQNKAK